jgi:DNA-binding NarL/FixJ family response regulator
VQRIRVVLAEMPRILRDIVQTVLAAQSDMVLTAAPASAPLDVTLDRLDADVVIVAESPRDTNGGADDERYATLLYAHPHLRIVGIAGDGRQAYVHELRPQRVPLGALSPETLVDAVRARRTTTREREGGGAR